MTTKWTCGMLQTESRLMFNIFNMIDAGYPVGNQPCAPQFYQFGWSNGVQNKLGKREAALYLLQFTSSGPSRFSVLYLKHVCTTFQNIRQATMQVLRNGFGTRTFSLYSFNVSWTLIEIRLMLFTISILQLIPSLQHAWRCFQVTKLNNSILQTELMRLRPCVLVKRFH
jgi:hypothetical protein